MKPRLAILGGGCAGLSLGSALAERNVPAAIFEKRERYVRDRTWCFWDLQTQRFGAAISHRWSRWAVRHDGQTVVRSAPGLDYVHVDGAKFYETALASIRGSSVELHLGSSIVWARENEGKRRGATGSPGARIETRNDVFELDHVYDTRPPSLPPVVPEGDIRLLQHFRGVFVRTDSPVFDATTVTLMDFDVSQDDGLAFMYVLPFSATEALVEATWFSESVHDARVYDAAIERWRRERLGLKRWTVLDTEKGVLPMTTEHLAAPRGAAIQRLGVGGGSAKPSTGYAFLAIQRQADALAERIARGEYAVPAARGATELAMDRVMLDWMTQHRERVPALFLRLFDRVDPRTLARFLSDRSSPRESLEVMRAVPIASFTAATARSAFAALRARL
ncbi:lycopene cyclase family protein [soil metagenome]